MYVYMHYKANRGRQTDTPGLCMLKASHINLTSFSCMRVDLVAQVRVRFVWLYTRNICTPQVLSSSVANAMENMGDISMSDLCAF